MGVGDEQEAVPRRVDAIDLLMAGATLRRNKEGQTPLDKAMAEDLGSKTHSRLIELLKTAHEKLGCADD